MKKLFRFLMLEDAFDFERKNCNKSYSFLNIFHSAIQYLKDMNKFSISSYYHYFDNKYFHVYDIINLETDKVDFRIVKFIGESVDKDNNISSSDLSKEFNIGKE